MKVYNLGSFTGATTGTAVEIDAGIVTPQSLPSTAVFQHVGTGTATMDVQGSIDGTNYITITLSTLAANTGISVMVMPYMRAKCISYTSGTSTCYLAR